MVVAGKGGTDRGNTVVFFPRTLGERARLGLTARVVEGKLGQTAGQAGNTIEGLVTKRAWETGAIRSAWKVSSRS